MQFSLDGEEMKVVNVLKEKLLTPLTLTLPKSYDQYIVDTDACVTQRGCALLLGQEEKVLKPLEYWSRSLCDVDRSYNTKHKEYSAVL